MKVKNVLFMIQRLYSDIINQATYDISDDIHSENLSDYYFKFKDDPQKLNKLIVSFDDQGVPLNTSYIDVENPRLHYYPISIGQYGLATFSAFKRSGDEAKKRQFINIANWFVENLHHDSNLGVYWLTDIPKPEYKVSSPWKSAFVQSRGLSILLRAWQLTGNDEYFKLCHKALLPYTFDITDGGVSAHLKTGNPFYEEYVASQPTMVLDGHLFALFGVYDYLRAVPKSELSYPLAEQIFKDGISGLEYWLPKFDLGFWVRFNLCQMDHYPTVDPCTIGYLKLIIAQLKIMETIHPSEILKRHQIKFHGYDKKSNYLRMYQVKYKALKKLRRI